MSCVGAAPVTLTSREAVKAHPTQRKLQRTPLLSERWSKASSASISGFVAPVEEEKPLFAHSRRAASTSLPCETLLPCPTTAADRPSDAGSNNNTPCQSSGNRNANCAAAPGRSSSLKESDATRVSAR